MNGEPTAAKSCEAGRSRVSGSAAVPFGFTTDAPRLPHSPKGYGATHAAGNFTKKFKHTSSKLPSK